LRIEANEALADTGGPGYYRGGNAQRTLYRFLSRGEFSLHDDRWFTKPWGIDGGKPGARSRKILWQYSLNAVDPPKVILPSKCDHIQVEPNDLLEWITWGGGGLGDPLTRPASKVALEVQRKLVTIEGAAKNYGVVVDPVSYEVCASETEALRVSMKKEGEEAKSGPYGALYDRGGAIVELREKCLEETGLPPPVPQWSKPPYGPHVAVPYVKQWYSTMAKKGDWDLE
jgi:5-oxoprolinase (ATP-hydrolysing)